MTTKEAALISKNSQNGILPSLLARLLDFLIVPEGVSISQEKINELYSSN